MARRARARPRTGGIGWGTTACSRPVLRESYRRTLEGFEQFCRKRGVSGSSGGGAPAAVRPTVGLAREYVELQRLERAPVEG